jgi:hypothetical protein
MQPARRLEPRMITLALSGHSSPNCCGTPRAGTPNADHYRARVSVQYATTAPSFRRPNCTVRPHTGPGSAKDRGLPVSEAGNGAAQAVSTEPNARFPPRYADRWPRAHLRRARRLRRPPRQERAQGQTGRQDAGSHNTARGQQDGPGGGHAPTQERGYLGRDNGKDGMATAYRPWVHGRRDEESRIHRRVFQTRGWGAHLPHQQVIANYSLPGPPGTCRGGLHCLNSQ